MAGRSRDPDRSVVPGRSCAVGGPGVELDEHQPTRLAILDNIALFSVGLIPVIIAVAVLRHRLYEIDVIIRRTLGTRR